MAQWALVTGATAGIGESFTRLLASKGYNVALVARDEARLHERAAGLREKYGVQTFVLPADLSTNEGCRSVEDYISTYEIEVLINNAGVAPLQRNDILDMTEESYERVMNINLKGPVFFAQKIAREMIWLKNQIQEYGPAIVFMSSVSAVMTSTNRGEYCISKAGWTSQ